MAFTEPIKVLKTELINGEIEEQSLKWDSEKHLYEFECELDTLDLIADGLPDDPRISNALNSLHNRLSNIHAQFKGYHNQ